MKKNYKVSVIIPVYNTERYLRDTVNSLINQKLLQLDNVILTPHIAFNSIDANYRILNTSMQHMMDFIDGKEIRSVA